MTCAMTPQWWRFLAVVGVISSNPSHASESKPKYVHSPFVDFSASLYNPAADYTTIVDPSKSYGTWEGWGSSLCWWANVYGDRDDLADAIYTDKTKVIVAGADGGSFTVPGLALNIARYNVGAESWNEYLGDAMVLSSRMQQAPWRQIHGFWQDYASRDPTSSSWNWTADANQIAMLKKAHARGADLLELFSNSPMWWMLDNHNPSGNSGIFGQFAGDNLQPWNTRNHSYYLATVASHAKKEWGIEFTSVEPFNEPISGWWSADNNQEGCHFDRETQAVVVKQLREELDKQGVSAIVSASDENEYDGALATWKSFPSDAKAVVGRVNVHGYQGTGGRRDLLAQETAGKKLWNSEYGDGDGSGMTLATIINLDFKWLKNTAWVYWQVLDNAQGWGLLLFDSDDYANVSPNIKWWVFAHYTRHIKPGMTIIEGGEANTIAAYDQASHRLVLVTTNYQTAQTVTYNLDKFARVQGPVKRWSTNTASDSPERYSEANDVVVDNKAFAIHFTSNTIQTFEIENVYLQDEALVVI